MHLPWDLWVSSWAMMTSWYRTASHTLQWRHNKRDGVSNHRRLDCLHSLLFRRRSKKASKLRITGLCEGNSPHKGPVTRKMFPFGDVIMRVGQSNGHRWIPLTKVSNSELWYFFSVSLNKSLYKQSSGRCFGTQWRYLYCFSLLFPYTQTIIDDMNAELGTGNRARSEPMDGGPKVKWEFMLLFSSTS